MALAPTREELLAKLARLIGLIMSTTGDIALQMKYQTEANELAQQIQRMELPGDARIVNITFGDHRLPIPADITCEEMEKLVQANISHWPVGKPVEFKISWRGRFRVPDSEESFAIESGERWTQFVVNHEGVVTFS